MGLEIRLTGPVTLDGGCGPRRQLSSAQAQIAMVRLTMERRGGTTRDQLADTLWPDGLPNTWASALRSVVSRVRAFVAAALPPGSDPLVAQAGRYLLSLPDDVLVDLEGAEIAIADAKDALAAGSYADAHRLASGAASCLRAPFLPDHDGEWVAGVRQRLADLLATGLETASLAASALGDHGVALGFANEAIRRAPLRESAHRCCMTAHASAGNRAEALRTYQLLRRSLAEEVGVDPAPETEVAYLDLLGTPSAVGWGTVGAGEAAALASPGRRMLIGPGSAVPFVGRGAELAFLADAWSRAQRGPSSMVLVSGEPGIGKTRLVTAAAQRVAAAGGLVLCGRSDRDAATPCQPFVEVIGGYLAATPADALPALTPAARAELAGLVPTDPSSPPPHGAPPGPDPSSHAASPGGRRHDRSGVVLSDATGPFAEHVGLVDAGASDRGGRPGLVDALTEVLDQATRHRAVLVVLDDVHFADRDSLALLRRVARQCAGAPLLIMATATDGVGRRRRFASVVHDLERDGWLQRLPVPGLGESDARALARHVHAGTPPARRPATHRLVAETAGNAFLLLELLRGQRDGGPHRSLCELASPGVHEYASTRLEALGDSDRELLRAAVVAGGVFELDLVADASGLAPADALDALDALLRAGLVSEVGAEPHRLAHRYRFRHEIVRRALDDQLGEARRQRLHARLADAIERLRRGELGRYTPALAHHRAAGAPPWGDRQAARWGLAAAARARSCRAPNEAVRLCLQALHHLPSHDHGLRAEALTNLGLAQHDAGDPDCDLTLLDGAIQARRRGWLDVEARAALGLADVVATRPRLRGEAAALVDDVVARAVTERKVAGGSVDELELGRLLARQVQLGGRAPIETATTGAAVRALIRELPRLTGPDHRDRRLALSADLLTVAAAVGDTRSQIIAAHHQAMAAELAGEQSIRDEALSALASAVGETHLFGDALLADRAVAVAVTQGRFTDAATTARLAGALAGDDIDAVGPMPGGMAARQMVVAAWLRGSALPPDDGYLLRPPHPAEEALAALAAGNRGRAHVAVRALATGAEPLAVDDEWPHAIGVAALAAVDLGDPTTAGALRALLLPYADLTCGVGYRSFVGPAAFHLGRLAFAVGDWPEAERHLTSALRQLAARGARPWVALTQHALAATLEARNRPCDRRWVAALRADADWAVAKLGLLPRDEPLLTAD